MNKENNLQQAAVIILKTYSNKFVVVTRKNSSLQVGFPGGKVDPGETPSMAVIRRVREETGIVLKEDKIKVLFQDIVTGFVDYETTFFYLPR